MSVSKTFLKLFIAAHVILLAACDLPSPKKKDSDSADTQTQKLSDEKGFTNSGSGTFTVELAPGRSSVLESKPEGPFQLPSKKIYNIAVCVKDVAYNKAVQAGKFRIKELDQEVRTDTSGCLTWKEEVKYNYLGDSKYLRMDRHLTATGLHRGTRLVSFAINPWAHGEGSAPILEIKSNTEVPQLVEDSEAVVQALAGHSRPVWLEDGRFFMTEQRFTKTGVELIAELRGTPSLQLMNIKGGMVLQNLSAGTFKIRVSLIHSYTHNDKEIHRLLGQSQEKEISMANGTLSVREPISLQMIPTRGQILAGIELVPVNGPADLKSFNGVYLLGDYDALKGTSMLKLSTIVSQGKDFKIADFLNAETSPSGADAKADANLETDAYQKPKIEFKYVDSPANRFLAEKETTSTRTLRVSLHTCLVNGIDQKTVRAHSFNVTKFKMDGSDATPVTETVRSDNSSNGCLTWYEDITFKAFDCHRFLKGTVKIENADLGVSETLHIAINPWDPYTLVRDLRAVQANENLIFSCTKEETPRTVVYMDGYSYSTNAFEYSVDSMLNLTVHKKLQMRISPSLLVYSSTSQGRGAPERMRDGVYLLKAAIIRNKDYDTQNTLVTYDQKLVTVQAGQINTELMFSTQDLRSLGNRNNLIVELYPVKESKIKLQDGKIPTDLKKLELDSLIDPDSRLETPTYVGPITLNADESARSLRVMDSSLMSSYFINGKMPAASPAKSLITDLVAQGRQLRAQVRAERISHYSTSAFAKDNNLALVNLEGLDEKAPLASQFGKPVVVDRLIPGKTELQNFIATGKLDAALAAKMCNFFVNDYLAKLYPQKGGAFAADTAMNMAMECFNNAKRNPSRYFQWEKRMLVRELNSSQFVRGLNQGVSVGTGFSLSASHSNSVTASKSWANKVGIGWKFMDIFSIGSDLSYQISWAKSDSQGFGNSISVNGSTSLTVQQNIFNLNVKSHEQCMVLRLQPKLFVAKDSFLGLRRSYAENINSRLSGEEAIDVTSRGLFLCEGKIRTEPTQIVENFYLIAQESSSTQIQDNGDVRNRSFFVALRSTNDFNRFLIAMKSEAAMPMTAEKEANQHEDSANMLMRLFDMPGSSAPGMFLMR